MKKIISLSILSIAIGYAALSQSVGIGTSSPNPSAQLDVSSTAKGMLIPRMTEIEKNAIPSPVQGLMVFNLTTNSFQYYNGVSWINISNSGIISGAPNRIAKFNSAWGLTPGMLTDNGVGVSLNNTAAAANASALLDMTSNNKGLLIPRMLSAERTAIVSPATGLLVFDNTTNSFWFYNGSAWTEINTSGGSNNWSVLGNNIYNSNTGNVGIGASTPFAKLTVNGDAVIATGLGIATTTPDLANYKLDVNGKARIVTSLAINDPFPDYNLDVNGTAGIEQLGVGGAPQPGVALTVTGDGEFNNNMHVDGTTVLDGAVSTLSTLTVNNGKGVAYNSTSATNLKIYPFTTATFTAVLNGFQLSGEGAIAFNGGFTGTPRVIVGDIDVTGGTAGELYRVQLILYGCQTVSGTSSCKARLLNTSPNPVNYTITWELYSNR